MTNPVPGHPVTTEWGITGPHWTGCGWHTGQDYAASQGTAVVAARAGEVRHVNYGSAFGSHQFVIVPGDGTEDFYAHCTTRPPHGERVEQGQHVAAVGCEGNCTGPHLHLERHKQAGSWSCSNMDDPMKSHNDGGGGDDDMTPEQHATLDRIEWMVSQIKPQTDQINPALRGPVDRVHWGVMDDAQGLRTMVADVQMRIAVIEDILSEESG